MKKLNILEKMVGKERYDQILDGIGKREGAAKVAGMVAKETQESTPDPTPAPVPDPVPVPAPATEPVVVGVTKEGLTEALAVVMKTFGDRMDAIEAKLTNTAKETKDGDEAHQTKLAEFETALKATTEAVVKLAGETPSGIQKLLRASEDPETVTNRAKAGPGADPDNSFAAFLFGGPK